MIYCFWIPYKNVIGCICLFPPRVELGNSKDCHLLKYYYVQKGELIHFEAGCCWKYALYPKMLQIKVVEHWILYKKVSEGICLLLPEWSQGAPKIAIFWNIIMFKNWEVDSFCGGWKLPKMQIISTDERNVRNMSETLPTNFWNILVMTLWNLWENLGATSELGTAEKIHIGFKGKFWNNFLERL